MNKETGSERLTALRKLIDEGEELEAESLAFALGVSEDTLRTDLQALGLQLKKLQKDRDRKLEQLSHEIYGESLKRLVC